MYIKTGPCFSPEEVELLRDVLDAAWVKLTSKERSEFSLSQVAEHILKLAADGERDPVQLREYALRRTRERSAWLELTS